LTLLQKLRAQGVDAEIYPSFDAKIKKQMKYADDRKSRFVVIIGADEMSRNVVQLKDMHTGHQSELTTAEFLLKFQKL
jgi:histidyl-tRNA synthetase